MLSSLIGPEKRAVRSNNSEGMGGEGGQQSVVVPAPPSPLHAHTSAAKRAGVQTLLGSPQNRKTSFISLLIHDTPCLRCEAVLS